MTTYKQKGNHQQIKEERKETNTKIKREQKTKNRKQK